MTPAPDALAGLPLALTAEVPAAVRALARGGAETEASLHRSRLMVLFESGAELTADEAGQRIGLTPFQVRPRISELARKYGRLEPSGAVRPSAEGNRSTVWRKRG